jgi:hypothetical protein
VYSGHMGRRYPAAALEQALASGHMSWHCAASFFSSLRVGGCMVWGRGSRCGKHRLRAFSVFCNWLLKCLPALAHPMLPCSPACMQVKTSSRCTKEKLPAPGKETVHQENLRECLFLVGFSSEGQVFDPACLHAN